MYNSNKVITLSQDTQKIVDRYLALSMGVIQEFIAKCELYPFSKCKQVVNTKYTARSQNTANKLFENTLLVTFDFLEQIFLAHKPFMAHLLLGICAGECSFLVEQGIFKAEDIRVYKYFAIYRKKTTYYVYFFNELPSNNVRRAEFRIIFRKQ